MSSSATAQEDPKGVEPHLYFGEAWRKYPKHRWFAGTAWHYTSVEGCFGIVSNHELWATAAPMLNDAGEMLYGHDRVLNVMRGWMPEAGAESSAVEMLKAAVEVFERTLVEKPLFVVSASKSPDLLNQWANYGDSSGCAVGLKSMSILVSGGKQGGFNAPAALPLWLDVLYDRDEQDAHIAALLNELVAPEGLLTQAIRFETQAMELAEQNLAMLVASLKHPGFKAEDEVRFVTVKESDTEVHYRPSPRGIVPYVRLLGTEQSETEGVQYSTSAVDKIRLPIAGVRVGPPEGLSESRRVASMREFLQANGYAVDVAGAGIPYLP